MKGEWGENVPPKLILGDKQTGNNGESNGPQEQLGIHSQNQEGKRKGGAPHNTQVQRHLTKRRRVEEGPQPELERAENPAPNGVQCGVDPEPQREYSLGEDLGQHPISVKVRKSKLTPGILMELERQEKERTNSSRGGSGAKPWLVDEGGDREDLGTASLVSSGKKGATLGSEKSNSNESEVREGKPTKDKSTEVIKPTGAEVLIILPDCKAKCEPKEQLKKVIDQP